MPKGPILIPDVILHDALNAALDAVREDYDNASPKTDSLLYKIFGADQLLGRYNMYDQAKEIILATEKDPKFLKVNLSFNPNDTKYPSIHISLPGEQSKDNSIGMGEGDYYQDEQGLTEYRKEFTRGFNTTYHIVIISDNKTTIIMLYQFFRTILISLFEHLNLAGFRNIVLGGSDVPMMNSQVAPGIFSRAIQMTFDYDTYAPEFVTKTIIGKVIYTLALKNPLN